MLHRQQSAVFDENVADAAAAKGRGVAGGQPAKARTALGDVGNLVGGLAARVAPGKDASAKCDASSRDGGLLASVREAAWGTSRQRTTSGPMTRGASREMDGARSLSTLLAQRSDAERTLPDIDSLDKENPLMVAEYANSIYSYYHSVEASTAVAPTYMSSQSDINDKMRAILVDWLVEVHLKFKLMPETLFLTVNLIDRYLAAAPVTRKNLQLVGVTAMLLASKYEEIWAPEVRDFVYISDKAYTREQILGCEKGMLNTLGFHLTVPTPFQFLSRLVKAAGADKPLAHLAQFYLELALPDYAALRFRGSELAAAAMYCAIRAGRGCAPGAADGWTYALASHSRYSEEALQPCAHALGRLHRKAASASLTAVFKKYSNPKFSEAAKVPSPAGLGEEVAPMSS